MKLDVLQIKRVLLGLVENLINLVQLVLLYLLIALSHTVHALFNAEIMTESNKKRKRSNKTKLNSTIADRSIIGGNWQKLLSSNLIMDKKTEKPAQTDPPVIFRRNRNRKKTNKNIVSTTPQHNLESTNNNIQIEEKQVSDYQNNGDHKNKLTKFIAMDCEMVGVGYNGADHMLARVSLVNKFGVCIYDKFVKAREEVTDYRTKISGIRKENLENGEDFAVVQKEVAEIIKGKILVGHSLKHDLTVLYLSHPNKHIRDTSKYKPFRKITKGSTPSLKRLSKEILNIDIQSGEHSSVEDARAAMQIYNTVAKTWENSLSGKRGDAERNFYEAKYKMDRVPNTELKNKIVNLEKEKNGLKKAMDDLRKLVISLQARVDGLESNGVSQPTDKSKPTVAQDQDSDNGVDLFGSGDGEENVKAAKLKKERLAAYSAKKSKKTVLKAKSNIILDVKPWDVETDVKAMEAAVRKIETDGLLWGAAKLVPLEYGILKLQISCVVEDAKVSIDWLTEEIKKNEDFVQSVNIAAFNKV